MKKRQSFIIVAVLILAVVFSGCSAGGVSDLTALKRSVVSYKAEGEAGTLKAETPEGFKAAAENEYLALYYSESTAVVRIFDKRTGKWWLSNPEDAGSANAINSQITVSTVSLKGVVNEYSSYTDSVLKKQVEFSGGDKLRVTYTFGNVKPDLSDIPYKLTNERFEELQKRAEEAGADERLLKRRYTQDKDTGIWTRKDLIADQAEKLKEWFEEIDYTAEELAADSAEAGGASADTEESGSFVIPLEYSLDGDSMLVRIPGEDIVYPGNEIITSIKVLEYFGALEENADGYFFVPNGSGALVNTSRQVGTSSSCTLKLYGKDYTIPVEKENGDDKANLLPVFGISRESDGVFAIIEDNDAVASVNVAKAGNTDEWNKVYASFEMNAVENIGLSSDAISKFYTTSEVEYNGDTAIRYIFLTENNHTYNGMAEVYRNYLDQNQDRKLLDAEEDIPLFVETVGSLEGQTSTLGFVHTSNIALTTFEDDINILKELSDSGISNINLILSAWMNNGSDQKISNNLDVISVLGGEKGLRSLFDYASENNVGVYPNVLFNTFSSDDSLSVKNRYAATTLGSEKSKMYDYDKITGSAMEENARYIVSPAYQMSISEQFLSLVQKKDIPSLMFGDMSATVYSDYNKKHEVLRQHSMLQSAQIIKKYADTLESVMLSSPNIYTAQYSNLYTDVPESSGSYMCMECSVPFYQMIYHGYADYSFEPLNFTADYRTNLLKCIEYGGSPAFRFIYDEDADLSPDQKASEYASGYSRWKDLACESYSEVNELLSPVRNAVMVNHTKISGGVYKVDYDNGYSIYVNYNTAAANVQGTEIEAMDAVCIKGEISGE